MIEKEYGDKSNPVILLIHGGGLSDWMWEPQIDAWKKDYHIIALILDGHGEACETPFDTIENCAEQVIAYINQNFDGKVFAICGLSIGAQITVEILSRQSNITQKAVIESAMVIPMRHFIGTMKFLTSVSYPLAKRRWFAKLQAKQMYIPDAMFEHYFADSSKIAKQSLVNLILSNAHYTLPENFQNNRADVLAMCGEQEYSAMKKSTIAIHQTALKGKLLIVPDCGHGVSIKLPEQYIGIVNDFFAN